MASSSTAFEITSSPLAESSSGRNHPPYDVFISHYGNDTKLTVANSIYERLSSTGLRTFLDKDELKLGDHFPSVLKDAIATASVHIVIFSENFCKSNWCLDELELMLQTNATFVPIFYHIEPYVPRWVKGIYADDFSDHEKKGRYDAEKLQSWKDALKKASYYKGEIVNNQCDEEVAMMNVVTCVLEELKKMRLDVAKHPVGLDEFEQDFHTIALQSMKSIQIVGIWGMGGSGKTTLAKHIYNKKCSTFKRSSFLFDVREAALKGRLHEKQKILLEELKLEPRSAKFDNIAKGKEILRSCLSSIHVLIVLDDVDHIDQLDALLPAKDILGHGSMIIVTTRELSVLQQWDISARYKIRTLNPSYARELFSWHAFGQPSPFKNFKKLVDKFIDACGGLPLSLKVIGSLLNGELRKEYWESQLEKLFRIVPKDIKSKLKISYDALDYEEREMFLDTACFFIEWPSNRAIATWEGSGWSGLLGWQKLVNKCLVELDIYGKIKMHDQLRDLGREIANKQSPYRLWSKAQIIEIQPQEIPIQIRGMADAFGKINCYLRHGKIRLKTSQGERILAPGSLGLKILIGEGDFIDKQCSKLLRELLCLHWYSFPHEKIPSWFHLKNLRSLELCAPHRLEDLWKSDKDAPLQLRHLAISGYHTVKKINALQRLRALETRLIERFTELKKIKGLKGMRYLETLLIENHTLKALSRLSELTSLKEIHLKWCTKLEKIEGLEGLRSLEILSIIDCRELNALPRLSELTSLKEIHLNGCWKLEKIEGLEGLRSVETLIIENYGGLKALTRLSELTSLKEIHLKWCTKLEKIEGLEGLQSLETLLIENCKELKVLSRLSELSFLKKIELKWCEKLEKIEGLEGLRSLETFIIWKCTELKVLPRLSELTSLKKIDLSVCIRLEKIEGIEGLRSLETLIIEMCTKLKTLPSLSELTSLEEFVLKRCFEVEKVEGLEVLRSLKRVEVHMGSMGQLKLPDQSERLKRVEVVGRRIGGVEACTREMQNWEREEKLKLSKQSERLKRVEVLGRRIVEVEPSTRNQMQKWAMICTMAVIDVRELLTSDYMLPEDVLHTYSSEYPPLWREGLRLKMPESGDSADKNAILICFTIRMQSSIYTNLSFSISSSRDDYFYTEIGNYAGESKWVWMGIFPRQSHWLRTKEYHIANVKVEEGWLMRGTEQSVREAFHHLISHRKKKRIPQQSQGVEVKEEVEEGWKEEQQSQEGGAEVEEGWKEQISEEGEEVEEEVKEGWKDWIPKQ